MSITRADREANATFIIKNYEPAVMSKGALIDQEANATFTINNDVTKMATKIKAREIKIEDASDDEYKNNKEDYIPEKGESWMQPIDCDDDTIPATKSNDNVSCHTPTNKSNATTTTGDDGTVLNQDTQAHNKTQLTTFLEKCNDVNVTENMENGHEHNGYINVTTVILDDDDETKAKGPLLDQGRNLDEDFAVYNSDISATTSWTPVLPKRKNRTAMTRAATHVPTRNKGATTKNRCNRSVTFRKDERGDVNWSLDPMTKQPPIALPTTSAKRQHPPIAPSPQQHTNSDMARTKKAKAVKAKEKALRKLSFMQSATARTPFHTHSTGTTKMKDKLLQRTFADTHDGHSHLTHRKNSSLGTNDGEYIITVTNGGEYSITATKIERTVTNANKCVTTALRIGCTCSMAFGMTMMSSASFAAAESGSSTSASNGPLRA